MMKTMGRIRSGIEKENGCIRGRAGSETRIRYIVATPVEGDL